MKMKLALFLMIPFAIATSVAQAYCTLCMGSVGGPSFYQYFWVNRDGSFDARIAPTTLSRCQAMRYGDTACIVSERRPNESLTTPDDVSQGDRNEE